MRRKPRRRIECSEAFVDGPLNGLSLARLIIFLGEIIAHYSADETVKASAFAECEELFRCKCLKFSSGQPGRISLIVTDFLSSPVVTKPTPSVIYEAHSIVGLLETSLGNHVLAARSFIKALWVAVFASLELSLLQVALTLHRLGKAHRMAGLSLDARMVLQHSIVVYQEAGLRNDHPLVTDARRLLVKEERKLDYCINESVKISTSFHTSLSCALSSIDEGFEPQW